MSLKRLALLLVVLSVYGALSLVDPSLFQEKLFAGPVQGIFFLLAWWLSGRSSDPEEEGPFEET